MMISDLRYGTTRRTINSVFKKKREKDLTLSEYMLYLDTRRNLEKGRRL